MYFTGIKCLFTALVITVGGVVGRAVSNIDNPVVPTSNCGRSKSSYVCDPDGLLSAEEGDALDKNISDILHHTTCPCTPQQCSVNNLGYKIGVALVKQMEIDREVHSLREGASGWSLMVKQRATAKKYASSLLASWQFGHCNEAVLIFCVQNVAMCYTAAGETARKKLTNDIVGEIAVSRANVNLTERLLNMIHDYKLVFLGLYNRTTNWQNTGNDPTVGRAVISLQPSLHLQVSVQCLIALLSIFVLLFIVRPQIFHHCHA